MSATLSLIDLAGAIALLLWGLHMVQSGIQRAFGPNLRRFLGRALGDRLRAFAAGIGVTAILQSSHRDRADGSKLCRRRARRSRAGIGDHARRQSRHDSDRPAAVLRYRAGRALV